MGQLLKWYGGRWYAVEGGRGRRERERASFPYVSTGSTPSCSWHVQRGHKNHVARFVNRCLRILARVIDWSIAFSSSSFSLDLQLQLIDAPVSPTRLPVFGCGDRALKFSAVYACLRRLSGEMYEKRKLRYHSRSPTRVALKARNRSHVGDDKI